MRARVVMKYYLCGEGNARNWKVHSASRQQKKLKEDLIKKDHLLRLEKCRAKAPMIAEVETSGVSCGIGL